MTPREKRIANAVARLAASCKRRPEADLARVIESVLRETKSLWVETVVEGLQSLHGSERFPSCDEITDACDQENRRQLLRENR